MDSLLTTESVKPVKPLTIVDEGSLTPPKCDSDEELQQPSCAAAPAQAEASLGQSIVFAAMSVMSSPAKKLQSFASKQGSASLLASRQDAPAESVEECIETGEWSKLEMDNGEGWRGVGRNLLQTAFGMVGRSPASGHQDSAYVSQSLKILRTNTMEDYLGTDNVPRPISLEMKENMEEGRAREITSDFNSPLRRVRELWRFRIAICSDGRSAQLETDTGDFLMHAGVDLEKRVINFHMYAPGYFCGSPPPAYTMSFSSCRAQWHFVKEHCENCYYSPAHLSCSKIGKQQLVFVRHFAQSAQHGLSNAMEVMLPGVRPDGRCVIWCPMLGKADLSEADTYFSIDSDEDAFSQPQHLTTCDPVWKEDAEVLARKFKRRDIVPSCKNFQLASKHEPKRVICQFGKVGSGSYAFDFGHPLSISQAFAIAMSTCFWA